jgi:hypothetical protein
MAEIINQGQEFVIGGYLSSICLTDEYNGARKHSRKVAEIPASGPSVVVTSERRFELASRVRIGHARQTKGSKALTVFPIEKTLSLTGVLSTKTRLFRRATLSAMARRDVKEFLEHSKPSE